MENRHSLASHLVPEMHLGGSGTVHPKCPMPRSFVSNSRLPNSFQLNQNLSCYSAQAVSFFGRRSADLTHSGAWPISRGLSVGPLYCIHNKVTRHSIYLRSRYRGVSRTLINEDERAAKKATAGAAAGCYQAARDFCSLSATRAQGLGKAPRRSSCRLRADRFHLAPDGHRRHRIRCDKPGASL